MVAADGKDPNRRPGGTSGPLSFEIAELGVPTGGTLGLAPPPGMREGRYRADMLGHDLDRLAAWGATAMLCLMQPHEVEGFDIERLSYGLRDRGIGFLHLPIPRGDVPDEFFDRGWDRMRGRLIGALEHGQRLIIQCPDGRVRSGIAAVRLLIDTGRDFDEALAALHEVHPNALPEDEQVETLRAYARRR